MSGPVLAGLDVAGAALTGHGALGLDALGLDALGLHEPGVAAATPRVAWTAAFVAWVLAVPMFFLTRFVYVVAHEAGHAIVAVALLRGVHAIRVRKDGGVTEHEAAMWPFSILILAAGYLGASGFGLLAAWLLVRGQTAMVLWASMALLFLMLFAVRGLLGLLLVPGLLYVLYQVATRADPVMQTLSAHVWTWFLLIASVQRMLLYVQRKDYTNEKSDTAKLGALFVMPNEVWAFILLVATIAALVWGGALLLRLA